MTTATEEIWRVVSYQSGTVTVQNFGPSGGRSPWVGVHYRPREHESGPATDTDRWNLAVKIARLLNDFDFAGEEFIRETETTGNWRGIQFSAIGPMIDKRPPTCWWIEDDSIQANMARFHLMDSICGKVPNESGAS